ncbi:DoxX family protein [Pseudomonas benzenivorans]|uniref:DoxX family protein n=1 Tax=Pseudomonas benzenivorans TaxID=556533 RepID=A0ABY5H642_9PSED|nr:DoxX family protein [Pseudomonas benzenivorans]UTW07786.1 DoxX family protein [Pseudomonas benzenivorans]
MNALIKSVATTQAGYGLTVLRIIAGVTFAAHGAQKLFGWFGGYGLEGVGQWMESIGLAPGYLMALLAGGAEFFGGLALIVGVLARPAAAVLALTMVVAIVSVHLVNGFFMENEGYEYALALLAISVAVLVEGAGKLSLDKRFAN